MDSLITQLASQVSLVKFISNEKNSSLTYMNRHYRIDCPFCRTSAKAITISADQKSWRCTTCTLRGNLVEFVMRREDIGYYQALRVIGMVAGIIPDDPVTDRIGWQMENPSRSESFNLQTVQAYQSIASRVSVRGRDYLNILRHDVNMLPVLDNVAFPKAMLIDWYANRRRPCDEIGVVSAMYENLQHHCKLEYPNLKYKIFDKDDLYDAGSIVWTKAAYAIIKDLNGVNNHYPELKVEAISTRGFCLITHPVCEQLYWIAPRDPRGRGGNRPLLLKDGSKLALESIIIDSAEISEYVDISGVRVELNPPSYGIQTYPK